MERIKIKATMKSKDQILKLAGEYAANYEKENGFTTHPKTASFHGYIAGYDDAKLQTPSPTGDRDCEELKRENSELAESLVQLNKVKNRFKNLISRIVGSMALERVERFDLNEEAKQLLNKHP